jgi:hypothetical protein
VSKSECTRRFVVALFLLLAIAGGVMAQSNANPASPPAANGAGLPDVLGIRVGIPAQEAYNLLKARYPRAHMGIGHYVIAGVTDKPVPLIIAVDARESDPPEVITLWLTIPPSKQVVWAIGREVEYDRSKPLLKNTVLAGLRQKYGPETDSSVRQNFWAFDEQGRRPASGPMKTFNCMSRGSPWNLMVAPPTAATYDYVTPLIYPPQPQNECSSLVTVSAFLDSPSTPEYVHKVTVMVSNEALARRSQESYRAYLANGDAAKQKAELEKAKERKGPAF